MLKKHIFGLKHSVKFTVERHEELNYILCDSGACIIEYEQKKMSAIISENQAISIQTAYGEVLSLCFGGDRPVFQVMQKFILDPSRRISIGSADDNDIIFRNLSFVSRHHADIVFHNGNWCVADHSRNGVCVNNASIGQLHRLHFGDDIYICGLRLVYFGTVLCVGNLFGKCDVSSVLKPYDVSLNRFGKINSSVKGAYFSRPARTIPVIHTGEVEIDSPPAPLDAKKKSLIEAIGRPLTMSIPMILGFGMMAIGMAGVGGFMSMGIITAVSSALIGAIWAILSLNSQTEEEVNKDRRRFNAYGNYLIAISRELASKYKENYFAMCSMYPSAAKCAAYDETSPDMWNRNFVHDDFLFVRLGLGNIPFQYNIKIPKVSFSVNSDKLAEFPSVIKNEYAELCNVPIGIDLRKNKLIGLVGSSSEQVRLAQIIITQLAANICYTDIKIVLLNQRSSRSVDGNWEFLRKLPHCWSNDQKTRFFSTNQPDAEDISYELLSVLRTRASAENIDIPKPYYIVILTDPSILDRNILSSYLLHPLEEYGVSTLILANSYSQLPNECRFTVKNDGDYCFVDDLLDANRRIVRVKRDDIGASALEAMAHRLANIRVDEKNSDQSIPLQVDFMSIFGASNVAELKIDRRWKNSSVVDSMSVPIGVKAGGALCSLDLHEKYHGPHGLVAGTTGSGKSELLQSLILSLCVNFSPNDVNFLIIDYKGGGMANLFAGLPHMAGQITNLSGNSIRRAMISIKSESLRRQRLFNDCSVNNINQYTKLYKEHITNVPIPHLVIIVDEFAELKKSEHEFMQELISIAQVGRSLGIHLILATQKPSGTVDENIRSNSKFRLCLRVQDKQDSMDMLHHPDAAYITNPGGAVFQVGSDEIFEPFQSAWSGAVYNNGIVSDDIAVILSDIGRPVVSSGNVALKRAEERKLAGYESIVGVIKELAGSDTDICGLNTMEALELCERVVSVLQLKNSGYRGSASALTVILRLFPKNSQEISDQDIVSHILQKSAETGVRLPPIEEQTQLEAVVAAVKQTANENGYNNACSLWLPCLPERLILSELGDGVKTFNAENGWNESVKGFSLSAVIGLADDPSNQSQIPLSIDFATGGHHAVIGSIASGKSTFIQTVLYGLVNAYSPDRLNLYIIDFSARSLGIFESLPHVGGVIYDDDGDRPDKLFWLLSDILRRRKDILVGGTYSEYVKEHREPLPAIVIVIDNYAGFKSKTDGRFESDIMRLSREGIACGMYLLVTGAGFGMTEIGSRLAENIRTVYTLELSDKYKYAEALHTTNIDILPETGVRGRGLVRIGERCLEYQTALINGCGDDYSRGRQCAEKISAMSAVWAGMCARQIPFIPSDPKFSQFRLLPEYNESLNSKKTLALGYLADTAELYSMDLDEIFCLTVAGQGVSNMRSVLKLLVKASSEKEKSSVYIVSLKEDPAQIYGDAFADEFIRTDEELFSFFKELTPEFVRRNKRKNELLRSGIREDEIAAAMRVEFSPVYVFIDDLASFIRSLYTPENTAKKMSGFFENITEKGKMHNIFLIGAVNLSETGVLNSFAAFQNYISDGNGILVDAAPSSQRLLNMSDLPYAIAAKKPSRGCAYIVMGSNGEPKTHRVVIPDADR
ncbi:MAG: FHA domain-containing protein [Oscillospiraceae bacterium]|nr:FHA domain-containing protein [Oscillospiraceae bacterium]